MNSIKLANAVGNTKERMSKNGGPSKFLAIYGAHSILLPLNNDFSSLISILKPKSIGVDHFFFFLKCYPVHFGHSRTIALR